LINPATPPIFIKEIKGLDMVRRDWSDLSRNACDFALDIILSGKPKEEVISSICDYLSDINKKLKVKLNLIN
jgi:DNA polymerase alpha subunit A